MPRSSVDQPLLIDQPTSALRALPLSTAHHPHLAHASSSSTMFYSSASTGSLPSSVYLPSFSPERTSSPSSSTSSSSSPPSSYAPQLCVAWEQGRCMRGSQCSQLHLSQAPSPQSSSTPLSSSHTFPAFPASSSSPSASALFAPYAQSFPHSSSSHPLYHSLFHTAAPSSHASNGASSSSASTSASSQYSDLDDFQLDAKLASLSMRPQHALSGVQSYHPSTSPSSLYPQLSFSSSLPMLPPSHRKECWDWLAGRCARGAFCKYSHANQGLLQQQQTQQQPPVRQNDNVCHQWTRTGQCQYGDVCKFAHITNGVPQPTVGGSGLYGHSRPHHQQQQQQQQALEFSDDEYGASGPYKEHNGGGAPPPPLIFRDARLGLDTEVCRFYAKHSRCKYSNACKFVHVHHGGGGMQVSGVNVTIAELHRLCALHGPGGMSLQSNGMQQHQQHQQHQSMHGAAAALASMAGMRGAKSIHSQLGAASPYEKDFPSTMMERELKELRDMQAQRDRAQSGLGSSSSSPSGPASFRELPLTSSTRSTPTLGGGLNGVLSPSLLQLSGLRQASDGKAVGGSGSYPSPLAYPSSSPSSSTSISSLFPSAPYRVASAELSAHSPSSSSSSPHFSHPRPIVRSSLSFTHHHTSADLSDFSSDYLDDDSVLISGSTYAALNGSGALASASAAAYGESSRSPSPRSLARDGGLPGGANGSSNSTSPISCQHCHSNAPVFHDAYSHLCEDCYTALMT